jgi:hypothetical protein
MTLTFGREIYIKCNNMQILYKCVFSMSFVCVIYPELWCNIPTEILYIIQCMKLCFYIFFCHNPTSLYNFFWNPIDYVNLFSFRIVRINFVYAMIVWFKILYMKSLFWGKKCNGILLKCVWCAYTLLSVLTGGAVWCAHFCTVSRNIWGMENMVHILLSSFMSRIFTYGDLWSEFYNKHLIWL